jgi:hypothetical protein
MIRITFARRVFRSSSELMRRIRPDASDERAACKSAKKSSYIPKPKININAPNKNPSITEISPQNALFEKGLSLVHSHRRVCETQQGGQNPQRFNRIDAKQSHANSNAGNHCEHSNQAAVPHCDFKSSSPPVHKNPLLSPQRSRKKPQRQAHCRLGLTPARCGPPPARFGPSPFFVFRNDTFIESAFIGDPTFIDALRRIAQERVPVATRFAPFGPFPGAIEPEPGSDGAARLSSPKSSPYRTVPGLSTRASHRSLRRADFSVSVFEIE